jgi:hypothetical protein
MKEKKMKKILTATMLISLTACNGGGGGGSGVEVVETSFSDSTVSNFQQVSGIAKAPLKWHDLLVPSAYAGGGDIRCNSGETVSLSMNVTLGADSKVLQFEPSCSSQIVVQIRRKLLESLEGHKLIREVSSADVGPDYNLDFTSGFEFGVPYVVLEKKDHTVGSVTKNCYLNYSFNYSTGSMSMNTQSSALPGRALELNSSANDDFGISNPNLPAPENSYAGCASMDTDFGSTNFRFKDGKIETDESNTGNFSPNGCALWDEDSIVDYKENGNGDGTCPDSGYDSTYERWCIDDNSDGTCDTL